MSQSLCAAATAWTETSLYSDSVSGLVVTVCCRDYAMAETSLHGAVLPWLPRLVLR